MRIYFLELRSEHRISLRRFDKYSVLQAAFSVIFSGVDFVILRSMSRDGTRTVEERELICCLGERV